jgi:hypothetical protein
MRWTRRYSAAVVTRIASPLPCSRTRAAAAHWRLNPFGMLDLPELDPEEHDLRSAARGVSLSQYRQT